MFQLGVKRCSQVNSKNTLSRLTYMIKSWKHVSCNLPVVGWVGVDATSEESSARVASDRAVVNVVVGNVATNLKIFLTFY